MCVKELFVFALLIETAAPNAALLPKASPVKVQLLLTTDKYQPLAQFVPVAGNTATIFPCRIASDRACIKESRKSLLAVASCWLYRKLLYEGTAKLANSPKIAMVIINSMRVKPLKQRRTALEYFNWSNILLDLFQNSPWSHRFAW